MSTTKKDKMRISHVLAPIAISTMLTSCASTKPTSLIQDKFISFIGAKERPLRPENFQSIALVPFVDGVNAQNSGVIVSQIAGQSLKNAGFDIQDRSIMNEVLKERSAIASGLFQESELQQIGIKAGARYIIHGYVTKYKSITLEKPGNEFTTLKRTPYGNVLETSHGESSVRELYTTGFRLRIIDVSTAKVVYEAEVSIDRSGFDNVKAIEAGMDQLLLYDYITSKSDSIDNHIYREASTPAIYQANAIHSFAEDALIHSKLTTNSERYRMTRKMIDSAIEIFAANERIIISNKTNKKYSYCDPKNFHFAMIEVLPDLFDIGDSAAVIACLKWARTNRSNDSASSRAILQIASRKGRSFSAVDQSYLRNNIGVNFESSDESFDCFKRGNRCVKKDVEIDSFERPSVPAPKPYNPNARYR